MASDNASFDDCRSCLCSALRRAGRAVTQHYEAAFRGSGLRATQFTVLATLALTGPVTISKLAGLLGMERTTVTRNLRPLETKRWVRTLSDETDQRLRRVELTATGRAVATKALPTWQRAQASAGPVLDQFGVALSAGPRRKS